MRKINKKLAKAHKKLTRVMKHSKLSEAKTKFEAMRHKHSFYLDIYNMSDARIQRLNQQNEYYVFISELKSSIKSGKSSSGVVVIKDDAEYYWNRITPNIFYVTIGGNTFEYKIKKAFVIENDKNRPSRRWAVWYILKHLSKQVQS